MSAIAFLERLLADLGELRDRRFALLGEIRIAVAEILVQIELEPFGELSAPFDRVSVVRKKLRALDRRPQEALPVAAPLGLAAVERRAVLDGDKGVLQRRPTRIVRMDIAGRDGLDAQRLGQFSQSCVTASVATLEGPLELDEEAVATERLRQPRRRVRVPHRKPMPGAARKADESLVALLHQLLPERRLQQLALLSGHTRARMRRGQQPAEVRVAHRRLDKECHVRPVGERHFGARDRTHSKCLRRLRELERAVDPVVVGQRKRAVAELGRLNRQLLRQRSAVEERIG